MRRSRARARGDRDCTCSIVTSSSRAISPGCGVMMTSTPSRPVSRSVSPTNAFSASASSTSGAPERSTSAWTNADVDGSCPRPGPSAMTSA